MRAIENINLHASVLADFAAFVTQTRQSNCTELEFGRLINGYYAERLNAIMLAHEYFGRKV